MNTRHRLLLILSGILVLEPSSWASAQDGSWIGEMVLPAKRSKDIKIGDRANGKQVFFPYSGRYPNKVRDENDGWLRIHDSRREGWVEKTDFVLVRDAQAYFHGRVQANPKDTWALYMRGVGYSEKKEYDKAIKDFNECIRLDPTDATVFNDRGVAWHAQKDYDKAIHDYTEAIRLRAAYSLGYVNRGNSWTAKKDYVRAIKDFDEAIRLDPKYTTAYNERGLAWNFKKDYDQAIKDYSEAIRQDPKYAQAFLNRGNVYRSKKEFALAVHDYEEAVRFDPKLVGAHERLAWTLATCHDEKVRDGKKAVEQATKACELTAWKLPGYLSTLAAAHAEAGNFEQATRYQKQALENSDYERLNGERDRQRLLLYEKNEPYHEK